MIYAIMFYRLDAEVKDRCGPPHVILAKTLNEACDEIVRIGQNDNLEFLHVTVTDYVSARTDLDTPTP
jgi:hypothetical protein